MFFFYECAGFVLAFNTEVNCYVWLQRNELNDNKYDCYYYNTKMAEANLNSHCFVFNCNICFPSKSKTQYYHSPWEQTINNN